MAGRPELAEETLQSATELGFAKQKHREREEVAANPILALARPGKGPRTTDRDGAMPESPELAAMTKKRIVSQRKWTRMKRGKRGSHLREETGEKGTARRKSCGGRRRRSSATSQSSRELGESEEDKMRGEERFNVASAHFNLSAGERERLWARGVRLRRFQGERKSGATVWGKG